MKGLIDLIDVMFVIFLILAAARVMKTLKLMKMFGSKNIKLLLTRDDDIEETKIYESIETLMLMMHSLITIFIWLYVHFWM